MEIKTAYRTSNAPITGMSDDAFYGREPALNVEPIKTKTGSGTDVTLTPKEVYGVPTVAVEFTHPSVGDVKFESTQWGVRQGVAGIVGAFYDRKSKRQTPVCATVPKADFDAAMRAAKEIGAKEIADIKSGKTPIQVRYQDGEYLSGHSASGRAGELLVDLGLAKDVNGWGTHVDSALVKSLGKEFTYAQAAEFARPALDAKQAKVDERAAKRAKAFAEASATGQRVELSRWTESVDDEANENSLDIVTEYAMPDGTTKTTRIPTH